MPAAFGVSPRILSGASAALTPVLLPLLLVGAAIPVHAEDQPVETILVYDARAIGVDPSAGASLTATVVEVLAARPGYTTVTLADLEALLTLEEDKRLLGCEEDLACLAEISRKANTRHVISSWIGKVGASVVLSLVLVDSSQASTLARVTETVQSLDEVGARIAPMLAQLMGWEAEVTKPRFQLPEGKAVSFAVFDLKAAGVPTETAQNLTQVLSAAIKQVRGTTVISSEDVDAMLQLAEEKERLGCIDDTECLAEIAGALGVDKLVVGSAGLVAEKYVVSLRLINAQQAEVEQSISESYEGAEEQLIGALHQAARQLLGVTPEQGGTLSIASNVTGATVYVDGEERGELPLRPIEDVTPGRHAIQLSKDGWSDWQSDVYVDPSATTAVWGELEQLPAEWYRQWWLWAGAGAVAVAAAGTAFGLYYYQATRVPETDLGTYQMPD